MQYSGFSDKLRQKCFVNEGIIYHDYDNMVFQKSFWVEGLDLETAETYETASLSKYLNLIFAGIPTGWVMSYNLILINNNHYLDTTKNYFTHPLLKLIDKEREFFFTKQAKIFKSLTVITFTFVAQQKLIKKLSKFMVESNKQTNLAKTFDISLEEFKNQLELYTKLLNRVIKLKPMTDDETTSYLNYLITGKWINFKLPKKNYIELKFLLGEEYIGGLEPKVGNKHLRVVAIDNYFPDESQPLMLERIKTLGFELRWNTRFIFISKADSQKNIQYMSDLYEQNITGLKDPLKSKVGLSDRKFNRGAEYMFEEAEEALKRSLIGNENHGKYGCNIILFHEDENIVKEQAKAVIILFEEMGYKARDERLNSEEAFLSSIDGDVEHNERRALISTENLADLLPISGFWGGHNYHPSPLYPSNSSSLFMVDCNNYHSFKGNTFVGDLGHTLVIGKTGYGKTTLLNFLIYSHMRYENAQVFALDSKKGMMPLCFGCNGNYFDLGEDEIAFQPLAEVDTIKGYDFAVRWLETLCELNNVIVSIDIAKAIRKSLSIIAVVESEHRTMQNLLIHISHINEILGEVVSLYVGSETLQAKILSANQDQIKFSNYNVFEMRELNNKGDKALIPILQYIFYKIMGRLDGRPTLIVIDEADTLWKNPILANQLGEWLKQLRSLNVYIVLAALQIQSINESSIKTTLLNQCATIFFTPNDDLAKTEIQQAYKDFGLKDKEIELIREGIKNKQYFLTNSDGSRWFNLDMNYFEIGRAFLCRTSIKDVTRAKQIKTQCKNNFANEWLKDSGIENIII